MSTHNTRSNNNNIDKSKSIKSNTNTDRDKEEEKDDTTSLRGRVVLVEEKIAVLAGSKRSPSSSRDRVETKD